MMTLDRQKRAVVQWSLTAALAGLPLALIIVGPAIVAQIEGRSLLVYASQLAVAALVTHIGFSVLAHHSYGVPGTMRWLLAAVALLAVPLVWATDLEAGVVAYFNFAAGTVGGVATAVVWKGMSRGYSWIDVGYIVFLVGGAAQLLVSFSTAASVQSLHQSSQTPWGSSNFVAGCLVVAALIVMARSARIGRYRMYAMTLGLVAIGIALLTLSRGAIVAASVGAMFYLWSGIGQQRPRQRRPAVTASRSVGHSILVLLSRALAILIPLVAFIAVEHVTQLRAQVNERVYLNVDTRLTFFRVAWEEFVQHPLTGTGWASFREATLNTSGQSSTFAHNLVLSMLQIGGLLSLPYLVALSFLAYRALRHGGPYAAAVAAAIAISMTDPFFESAVGNLIVLPVAFLAGLSATAANEDDGGAIVNPRTDSTRTRLRPTRRMQPEWVS